MDFHFGLIMVLHSWGQQVGFHVHVHIILTGGGLSLDKDPDQQRWIDIPPDHPALEADALSLTFKRLFLRRLKEALRRSKLLWPETLLAGEVLSDEPNPKTACTCRHCQGQLQVLGRLKGNETLHAKSLAAAVISLLPAIAVADIQSFVQQLSSGVLHLWQLSEPLQEVIPSEYDFSPLELFALAGLLHAYQSPTEEVLAVGFGEAAVAFCKIGGDGESRQI